MMRRTIARILALLALAAAAVAVVLVVQGAGGTSSNDGKAKGAKTTKAQKKTSGKAAKPKTGGKKTPRVYVVKSGDTLSRIALKTHVSVSVIQELNPNLDPTTLQTGQKIKLKT
jgi:LysM repeat protein